MGEKTISREGGAPCKEAWDGCTPSAECMQMLLLFGRVGDKADTSD